MWQRKRNQAYQYSTFVVQTQPNQLIPEKTFSCDYDVLAFIGLHQSFLHNYFFVPIPKAAGVSLMAQRLAHLGVNYENLVRIPESKNIFIKNVRFTHKMAY